MTQSKVNLEFQREMNLLTTVIQNHVFVMLDLCEGFFRVKLMLFI